MSTNKQALRIPKREKHNWGQAVMHTCDFCDQYAMTITSEDGEHSCASCLDAEYVTVLTCALEMAIDRAEAAEKRIAELEKGHCGAPLLEREEAHVKTVSGLLAELGKWQQESSTWKSVAEKQLTIAVEAEKRIAELEAREINLPPNELVTDTWTSPGDGWEVFDAQKVIDSIRSAGVRIAAGITVKGGSE